jgi:hypothetical protein
MYDSFLASKIGQWVMGMEEEGMDTNGYVPETARCWGDVSVEWKDGVTGGEGTERRVSVRARQNFVGEGGSRE